MCATHAILAALRSVGFINVHCQTELGIFRSYLGRREPIESAK